MKDALRTILSSEKDALRTILSSEDSSEGVPASSALGHYLVSIEGIEQGRIIEIGDEPLTIGRGAGQALVFDDHKLSRLHAKVSLVRDEVVAEDLGSTNGTHVDGMRIVAPITLRDGSVLRVGQQLLKYERRDRREVERNQELNRDLREASEYVMSLLPAPLDTGPVRTSWRFLPSAQLGGDAFGYYWLDPDTFVFYLLDVSGHGVGAGMHSVTVLNMLRQRALPGVDFTNPAAVLSSLNSRFQMGDHDGMFFTIWYGVYHVGARDLDYTTAGHHPAYLVPADKTTVDPLGVPALIVGAIPDVAYEVGRTKVPRGSTLYVFSDGVFEIVTKEQQQWRLRDFIPYLGEPTLTGIPEPERLYRVVKERARPGLLDDDFSLLTVTFQ